MATTVRQMLAGKPDAHAVAPTATVLEALQLMADKDIGAVLVIADGVLVGIFTERDYARKVALQGRSSKELLVRDVMSAQVVTIDPAWTADRCLALMDERRIRHLPVVEGGRAIGVVSMRAVVRAIVAEQQYTIDSLEKYISTGS